ncbi:hypothetical protein [Streptomyces boncukensis]|uniref:Uncharacterized protein n=1 Tax=Streptomyces boncukensis TaxID=2711219 RepID=A0A6G4X6D2_9ACTN|nr:hypothetical protein [Streptomyces boncukensis]NGO72231.1 hypothetical protein [Streptomyces boncukensis]
MGLMTVLYIAFGIVALWLLGEVLLQYKARLRWRLLAFAGFMGVVVGAVLPSVIVIGVGIAAFATGQAFVTLSYRRGFSTGWALGGSPGSSRRRRGAPPVPEADPSLEITGLEPGYDPGPAPGAAPGEVPGEVPGMAPDAVPDYAGTGYPPYPDPAAETQIQPGYGDYPPPAPSAPPAPPVAPGEMPAEQTQAFAYDEQQGYAAYAEQYAGEAYGQYPGYGYDYEYGGGAVPQPPQAQQGYADYSNYPGYSDYPDYSDYAAPGAPPAEPYYPDTPPGGVWVPQQRDGAGAAPPYGAPEEQQPYPYGYYEEPRGH